MIVGIFHDRFPRVSLLLPFLDGNREVDFVLDTGFDGYLTLPSRIIQLLECGAVQRTDTSSCRWL